MSKLLSRHGRIGMVAVAGLGMLSCQTVSEQMPEADGPAASSGVPVMVIVLPTAVPRPTAPTAAPEPTVTPGPAPGEVGSCTGPNCAPPVSVHAYVHGISCN